MKMTLLVKSRITEVGAVSVRMISAFKATSLSSDANLSFMFNKLEDLSERLSRSINPQKALSNLQAKDAIRDDRFRSLYYRLRSSALEPDTAVRNAAEHLLRAFEPYGLSIVEESYATESTLVNALLDKYAEDKQQASIALILGAKESIVSLKESQREFETARTAYERESSREDSAEIASDIKPELFDLINGHIVLYLRVMASLDPAQYGEFAATIGKIIGNNNEAVRRRSHKTPEAVE